MTITLTLNIRLPIFQGADFFGDGDGRLVEALVGGGEEGGGGRRCQSEGHENVAGLEGAVLFIEPAVIFDISDCKQACS
ncbi:MAG: hypothetical protein HDS46_04720 [Bacteroides sp.]|nr:hypothetical protein [Bacteroides sp.]